MSPKSRKISRPLWIPVVAAFMTLKGKILLGRRPEGQNLPGLWEFPGGKIELGETPEIALQRELQEELGIVAEIGPIILSSSHQYGNTGILLIFYKVEVWRGQIHPVHHTELKWFSPEEIKMCSLPEANYKVLERLVQTL
ncbi:MAG: (deoxy)nucleoside triphosphate pyrophosphohydrolase [Bdellovibrionales bacterium]|nr:(deoxy)nucleoside triphosphate pyrophosphohydrolase [Bdellovibrionales bacterium]